MRWVPEVKSSSEDTEYDTVLPTCSEHLYMKRCSCWLMVKHSGSLVLAKKNTIHLFFKKKNNRILQWRDFPSRQAAVYYFEDACHWLWKFWLPAEEHEAENMKSFFSQDEFLKTYPPMKRFDGMKNRNVAPFRTFLFLNTSPDIFLQAASFKTVIFSLCQIPNARMWNSHNRFRLIVFAETWKWHRWSRGRCF